MLAINNIWPDSVSQIPTTNIDAFSLDGRLFRLPPEHFAYIIRFWWCDPNRCVQFPRGKLSNSSYIAAFSRLTPHTKPLGVQRLSSSYGLHAGPQGHP
jgi:hypothetical protein